MELNQVQIIMVVESHAHDTHETLTGNLFKTKAEDFNMPVGSFLYVNRVVVIIASPGSPHQAATDFLLPLFPLPAAAFFAASSR